MGSPGGMISEDPLKKNFLALGLGVGGGALRRPASWGWRPPGTQPDRCAAAGAAQTDRMENTSMLEPRIWQKGKLRVHTHTHTHTRARAHTPRSLAGKVSSGRKSLLGHRFPPGIPGGTLLGSHQRWPPGGSYQSQRNFGP